MATTSSPTRSTTSPARRLASKSFGLKMIWLLSIGTTSRRDKGPTPPDIPWSMDRPKQPTTPRLNPTEKSSGPSWMTFLSTADFRNWNTTSRTSTSPSTIHRLRTVCRHCAWRLTSTSDKGTTIKYDRIHRVLAEGNFVLSVSEGSLDGVHSAFYDLFRVADGRLVEHWDTIEAIAPRSEWKNDNGKF